MAAITPAELLVSCRKLRAEVKALAAEVCAETDEDHLSWEERLDALNERLAVREPRSLERPRLTLLQGGLDA